MMKKIKKKKIINCNVIISRRIVVSLLLLVVVLAVIPVTLSRYSSSTNSNSNIDIAFYLLETNYYSNSLILNEVVPRNDPYIYNFTISNNDGEKRLETRLEYDLKLIATTNLPLRYELYLNENYNDVGATNIINSRTYSDDDGTYFTEMTTSTEYFSYVNDEINTYQLVIYFPSQYTSYLYQDVVEYVGIDIDSRQIIAS